MDDEYSDLEELESENIENENDLEEIESEKLTRKFSSPLEDRRMQSLRGYMPLHLCSFWHVSCTKIKKYKQTWMHPGLPLCRSLPGVYPF